MTSVLTPKIQTSPSGELIYCLDKDLSILHCEFKDIRKAGRMEFLATVSAMGYLMKENKTGKMCMDISLMKNFDIQTRIMVVKNLKPIFFDKIPFLALAVVKGPSLFENMTMQLAVLSSQPLSSKFLKYEFFENIDKARNWLTDFKAPK